MAAVLMVSKPVVPPWNDSSKNLVRDLARHLPRHRPTVLVPRATGGGWPPPQEGTQEGTQDESLGPAVRSEAIYGPGGGRYAPALRDNVRVLGRLLFGKRPDLMHFFFAPNPRTSLAGRVCVRARRVPSLQTVCSAPRPGLDLEQALFADRVVVLSQHTQERFVAAGIAQERLVHIPPCVPACDLPEAVALEAARARHDLPAERPLLVYPGDLEFGAGADRALAALADLPAALQAHLVIASRPKTPRAQARQEELAGRAIRLGLGARVHMLGAVPDIHALLALASVVLLPSETLYAKMDLPLVVLEAMSLRRAVLVLADTPPAELAVDGGLVAVPDERAAINAAVLRLLQDAEARRVLGERAREHVLTHHDPRVMAERYAVVYDALLTEGPRHAGGGPQRPAQ